MCVDILKAREGGDDGVDYGLAVGGGRGARGRLEDLVALVAVKKVVARKGAFGLVAVGIGVRSFWGWCFDGVGCRHDGSVRVSGCFDGVGCQHDGSVCCPCMIE